MSELDQGPQSAVKRALVEIRRLKSKLAEAKAQSREPVAVVGLAIRAPAGATDAEAFWALLTRDGDAIEATPASRWNTAETYDPEPDAPGRIASRHGAFLADPDLFDAEFFGITPREAESMDPQHRLLLEATWEALENAAIAPSALAGSRAGVFVGLSNSDYGRMLLQNREDVDAYTSFGAASSIGAGRISYFLNAQGPSVVVDTACSSGLAAVHLACNSLHSGETDVAIVGAANLILSPEVSVSFTKARMLAPDGRCKTFDEDADGYVRGEGCIVVVLKPLSKALAAKDRVLAVIAGSAMNHDGRSAGLTAPNGPAQERVIEAALEAAKIEPQDVDYVEAHGTGTPLGDPIEVQALAAVYGRGRSPARALRIGSVKTVVGHLEAAAGLAGLAKVALGFGHERLPASRNFSRPNSRIAWDELPIRVVARDEPWPRGERPRRAGLSAFGFSGTNVHLVLAEPPAPPARAAPAAGQQVLCLSAPTHKALRACVQRYRDWLPASSERLEDVCYTAALGRSHHAERAAFLAGDSVAMTAALEEWLRAPVQPPRAGASGSSPDLTPQRAVALYLAGGDVDWSSLYAGRDCRRIAAPTYPFQRQSFWRPAPPPAAPARTQAGPAWAEVVRTAQQQSESGPLGWDIGSYEQRWARMDDLTAGEALNTLLGLGAFQRPGEVVDVDRLIAEHGVAPRHRNLVNRWLKLLARHGTLRVTGGGYAAPGPLAVRDLSGLWIEIERLLVHDPDILAYARRASGRLRDLVTGCADPLEVLFAQGSFDTAEGLYERSPSARYLNGVVAAAVDVAMKSAEPGAPFRLFEAGAGTGGTTSRLAPGFPEAGEYWFTDLSDAFLGRARRKHRDNPAFRFARYNLDEDVYPEGLEPGFDVVLAANVVHATRDVDASIDRLRRLLKPGGLMILVETTTHYSIFDLTIGFVEGWSSFADKRRKEHPLLDADAWVDLAKASGFVSAERFPDDASAARLLGQHIIVAQNGATGAAGAAAAGRGSGVTEASAPRLAIEPLDLAGLEPRDRHGRLADLVRHAAAEVMRLRPSSLPRDRDRFTDLGMDSLMALQLKSALASALGIDAQALPATLAFDAGTVEELTRQLLALTHPPEPPPAEHPFVAPTLTEADLATLSDEEVEALLSARLGGDLAESR